MPQFEVQSYNPYGLNIQAGAADTAAIAMGMYRDSQAVDGSDLANVATDGYQKPFVAFSTAGYHGKGVRARQINQFEHESRGAMRTPVRPWDLAVAGRGFLVVDYSGSKREDTPPEHGMKVTGHFHIDADGFVEDEAGNYLMGVKANPDGTTAPFSLLHQLERIQLSLSPSTVSATDKVEMLGCLPSDRINVGDSKENAVDIYDSLGVPHQINFVWTKTAVPQVWRLEAFDSDGVVLKQGSNLNDAEWAEGTGGLLVNFDSHGEYGGCMPLTNTPFADWNAAYKDLDDVTYTMSVITQQWKSTPNLTEREFTNAVQTIVNAKYDISNSGSVPSKVTDVIATIGTTSDVITLPKITAAQDQANQEVPLEKAARALLQAAFQKDAEVPPIYATDWRTTAGNLNGAEPSTIHLDLHGFMARGDRFILSTPLQNGCGSSAFQGICVQPDGFLTYNFANQPQRKAWLIPLITYPNNNGFEQGDRNILRPTASCGQGFTLAAPGAASLGTLQGKMIVTSNVQAQDSLLHAHRMAEASQENGTLYKMAMDVYSFFLNIFAQI